MFTCSLLVGIVLAGNPHGSLALCNVPDQNASVESSFKAIRGHGVRGSCDCDILVGTYKVLCVFFRLDFKHMIRFETSNSKCIR